jgi:hypothetical protein
VTDEPAKIDLRTLGEPARLVNGAGAVDIIGRRDRILLVVLTKLAPFHDIEALRDNLSALKVPCLIVPEEFVQDIHLLTREELNQVKEAAVSLLNDTVPTPLTPERAKEAARRVYEGLRQRPELKEAVLQLLLEDAERRSRDGHL